MVVAQLLEEDGLMLNVLQQEELNFHFMKLILSTICVMQTMSNQRLRVTATSTGICYKKLINLKVGFTICTSTAQLRHLAFRKLMIETCFSRKG